MTTQVGNAETEAASRMDARERTKVVYILAWGRSGSTILDNVLGEVDGFFSAGEIRFLWVRGVTKGWRCGCGKPVVECEVWSAVLRDLSGVEADGDLQREAKEVESLQNTVARVRHTWRLLRLSKDQLADPSLRRYTSLLDHLFHATSERSAARVVIDSSKRPSDAAMLTHVAGVDLYAVHLVRDPRAVAHSWAKRNYRVGRHGVVKSTVNWVTWNLASEAVARRLGRKAMLVRYEDFVADPRRVIHDIVTMVGEDAARAPDLRGNELELSTNHTVSGNPSRFRTGAIKVRPDERWRNELATWKWWVATLVALPLLGRYRYAVRRGKRHRVPDAIEGAGPDLGPTQLTRPPRN